MPPTSTPRDQPPAMTPSCRVRRPLHLELVAGDVLDVEVALDRPYADQLAAWLAELAKVDPVSTELPGPAPLRIPGSQPLPDPDPAHTRPSRPTRHRRPCWPERAPGCTTSTRASDRHRSDKAAILHSGWHPSGSRLASGPLGIVTCATRARGDRRGPTHWLTVAALVLLRTKP